MNTGLNLIIVAICMLAIGTAFLAKKPGDEIVALDIGQGDSFFFEHGSQQLLIDGGQGQAVLQRLAEEMPWFDRTIETVIVTHPQRDHMEGLLYVLGHYNVGLVLLPQVPYGSALQHEWLQQLVDHNQAYRFAWQGDHLSMGELQVDILSPIDTPEWHAAARKEVNNASIVTRISFGNLRYFGSGDGEKPLEDMVIANNPARRMQAEILKAGHHGSKTSTGEALLAAVSPRSVFISVGAHNTYGHPHRQVLDSLRAAGVAAYRTDQNGSIHLRRIGAVWSLVCGNADLPWQIKSCIKNT